MSEWPPIAEPELLRRLPLGDEEFGEFIRGALPQLPAAVRDAATISPQALGYPVGAAGAAPIY